MIEGDIKQSLSTVLQSIEALNQIFEARLSQLRMDGVDEETTKGLEQGLLAMKDAGRLYITWTDHFIERLDQGETYGELLE